MAETVVYKLPEFHKRRYVKKVLRQCGLPEYEIRKITDFVAKRKGQLSYTHFAFYMHLAIKVGFEDVSDILCFVDSLLDIPKEIVFVENVGV